VGDKAPTSLPLKLEGGAADLDGTVTGSLENPVFRGQAAVTKASVEGHGFDRFEATGLEASKDRIRATKATLVRGNTEISGRVTLQADQGSFENAGFTTTLALQNVSVEEAIKELGGSLNATGILSASVRASGTLRDPQGD